MITPTSAADGTAAVERRFRALADAIDGLVFTCAAEGACTFANEALSAFMGRESARLLGHAWLELVHEGDRARLQDRYAVADSSTTCVSSAAMGSCAGSG